ncbi:SMP-30/gluconolactonase/LRE family protein [Amycolatopsis sp. GM8]|uniref:SMP-30/gluconolactonase/LRE family protein n=1 Tax=Amycolatopsis sp. GM8 TaxID=2896530 RepID=UPI001F21DF7E|nr:SMP-30/gluconolactonase/LRE family protein [Amycolatopsis sp. GM8]
MRFTALAQGFGFAEGPVWAPDGTLWISSISEGAVFHLDPGGTVLERIEVGGGANGLTVDHDGTIYVAQNGGIWGGKPGTEAGIQIIRGDRVDHLVRGMDAPNDLCFGRDGRLYFTDSRAQGKPAQPEGQPPGRLYSVRRDGSDLRLLHEGLPFINGLAFAPDGEKLYLVSTGAPHYLVHGTVSADGTLGPLEKFVTLEAGWPDGIAVDAAGNVWVAATVDHSVQVYSPDGAFVERIQLPEGSQPTNLCFGGPSLGTLYVTASKTGEVLVSQTDTPGLALHG